MGGVLWPAVLHLGAWHLSSLTRSAILLRHMMRCAENEVAKSGPRSCKIKLHGSESDSEAAVSSPAADSPDILSWGRRWFSGEVGTRRRRPRQRLCMAPAMVPARARARHLALSIVAEVSDATDYLY